MRVFRWQCSIISQEVDAGADQGDSVRNRLDPDSWAAHAWNEIEDIQSIHDDPDSTLGQKLRTLPALAVSAGKFFFGSGEVIKASFEESRAILNEKASNSEESGSTRAAASILRYTLASRFNEVFVQGTNSVGQSGPLAPIVCESKILTGIATNRITVKTIQLTAVFNLAHDVRQGEFDSENVANSLLLIGTPELVFRNQTRSPNGSKVQVTTWRDPLSGPADLNMGATPPRWVVVGKPSLTSYRLTALPYGKIDKVSRFPYLKFTKGVPYHSNLETDWIPIENLHWPKKPIDWFRGLFDQGQIW